MSLDANNTKMADEQLYDTNNTKCNMKQTCESNMMMLKTCESYVADLRVWMLTILKWLMGIYDTILIH